jgi:hypothetical protein
MVAAAQIFRRVKANFNNASRPGGETDILAPE